MICNQQVFRWRSLIETFADPQTWILCLMTCLISLPSGVITTYSSMLIRNFGFTPKEAALLNMPSGIVSIAFTILSTYVIARGWQRWVSIIACLIPTLVGASLMSFLPKTNQAGLLCGIYLVNAVSCFLFFPSPLVHFFRVPVQLDPGPLSMRPGRVCSPFGGPAPHFNSTLRGTLHKSLFFENPLTVCFSFWL